MRSSFFIHFFKVADERSVIWKLEKKFMAQMEKVNPKLAVAIHHHILKFSLVCRERLEKEVSGLESLDHQLKKTKKKKTTSYWNRRTNLLSHSKPDEIG